MTKWEKGWKATNNLEKKLHLAPTARSQIYNITLYKETRCGSFSHSFHPSFSSPPPLLRSRSSRLLTLRNATHWWLGIGPQGDEKEGKERGRKEQRNESSDGRTEICIAKVV